MDLNIREVKEADAEAILAIYAPYIEKTAITFEYTVPTVAEFRERIARISSQFPYIVAEVGGKIAGYAYASTFHERAAYLHSAELSIYVDEKLHGGGIGRTLYEELEKRLFSRDITALYACIAVTPRKNDAYLTDASPRFHEKLGYAQCGYFTHCAVKFDVWYDIAYYEKHLGEKI